MKVILLTTILAYLSLVNGAHLHAQHKVKDLLRLTHRIREDPVTNGKMNEDDEDSEVQVLCSGYIPVKSMNGEHSMTCNLPSHQHTEPSNLFELRKYRN